MRPVEHWCRGKVLHFFPLDACSLGKYFLAPILQSYQIRYGGLIRKCALARPKYACIADYYSGLQRPAEIEPKIGK